MSGPRVRVPESDRRRRSRLGLALLMSSALALAVGTARPDELVLRPSDSTPESHADAKVVLLGLANQTAYQGLYLRLEYDPRVARPVSITGVGRLGDARRLHYWVEQGSIRALICDLSNSQSSIEPGDGPIVSVAFVRSDGAGSDALRVSASDVSAVTDSRALLALPATSVTLSMERTVNRAQPPVSPGGGAIASGEDAARSALPTRYALQPAGLMPFSASATLLLDVPRPGQVHIAVYDTRGRLVRQLSDRVMDAGRHTIFWDGTASNGSRAGAGLYIVRAQADGVVINRKIIALR